MEWLVALYFIFGMVLAEAGRDGRRYTFLEWAGVVVIGPLLSFVFLWDWLQARKK